MGNIFKGIVDGFVEKFVSRKLLVFILATLLMFGEKISGENWVNIAIVYIGVQATIDAIVKLRGR